MKKVAQYLAFALVLAVATIVAIQFIPAVRRALELVVEFEAARTTQDAQKVSRLLAPGVFTDLDRARKQALTGKEQEIRKLPFADRLLVLTLRAAVVEKRLDLGMVRNASPAALHVALLQAGTKMSGTPAPVSIPLFGIPSGPGRVSVWIGPAQSPSYLVYVMSVLWNLRGEVITAKDGKRTYDPSIMLRASAQENVRLLGGVTGNPNDAVLLAYLRYKGSPRAIWQPLSMSQGDVK